MCNPITSELRLHAVFYVPAEEKEYPEIPVSEFPAHVASMHSDGDFAFSQEFEVSEINILFCFVASNVKVTLTVQVHVMFTSTRKVHVLNSCIIV